MEPKRIKHALEVATDRLRKSDFCFHFAGPAFEYEADGPAAAAVRGQTPDEESRIQDLRVVGGVCGGGIGKVGKLSIPTAAFVLEGIRPHPGATSGSDQAEPGAEHCGSGTTEAFASS